jgi:hypothetical protein
MNEGSPVTTLATPAASKPRRPVDGRRLLLVVDDACTAPELCASVREFERDTPIEALVIAPAGGTASTQWFLDEDAARADATHRLRTCLTRLASDGISVRGELSDPDPIQGIADALHEFPADEILLISPPQRPSRWLRQSVIERARDTFREPITHIVMTGRSERNGK